MIDSHDCLITLFIFCLVPSGFGDPVATGYNASAMNVTWQPPSDLNGPLPFYVVSRSVPALSIPPPSVEVGVYFPGRGHYLFPSDVIPQGVGYTGRFEIGLLFPMKL